MPEAQIVDCPKDIHADIDVHAQAEDQKEEVQSAVNHPNWYFDSSHWFFKVLRFANFLEPSRCVLSMTKIMLWAATFQTILVISTSNDVLTVAGALGLNVATMIKHETRRKNSGVGD